MTIWLADSDLDLQCFVYIYLHQVNRVNFGRDSIFIWCVHVCMYVSVCARWRLNANNSKMVTSTDFKFDVHVPRDTQDMIP